MKRGASATGANAVAPGAWLEKLAGGLERKTLACAHGSGGMTLDNEGDLHLTGDGVAVFDKAGRQIGQIRVPGERWTANVSFGGRDRQTLFITASTGLYGVRMRVTGANAAK